MPGRLSSPAKLPARAPLFLYDHCFSTTTVRAHFRAWHTDPTNHTAQTVHLPSHAGTLPPGVDPIPVPDTTREAEMLLILLGAGLHPKVRRRPEGDRKMRTDPRSNRRPGDS